MKDYYAILGLKPECTNDEIRRAYRVRAKALHPDHGGEEGTARFLALKEAYEILLSPTARDSYDTTRQPANRGRAPSNWDYRDFLHQRKDDPVNLAKLICFDLLHDKELEALELYNQARSGGIFSLRNYLDREDFMDYGYLLAEAYLEQKAFVKAYRLLRGLAELEEEDPYFKHFYVEVLDRLAAIVRHPLPEDVGDRLRMAFLTDLVRLSYPAREEARLRKLLSELLSASGRHEAAAQEVLHAYRLAPNLPGLGEIVGALQSMGFSLSL